MNPIKLTSRQISEMPAEQRIAAIGDVLDKDEKIGLRSKISAGLRRYLGSIADPVVESEIPYSYWPSGGTAMVINPSTWNLAVSYVPELAKARFFSDGIMSRNVDYSTVYVDTANGNFNYFINNLNAVNQGVRDRNAAARSDFERRVSAPPPSADLDVLINSYNRVADKNSNDNKYKFARAFRNKHLILSTTPLSGSSIDMFAGILRGNHG